MTAREITFPITAPEAERLRVLGWTARPLWQTSTAGWVYRPSVGSAICIADDAMWRATFANDLFFVRRDLRMEKLCIGPVDHIMTLEKCLQGAIELIELRYGNTDPDVTEFLVDCREALK